MSCRALCRGTFHMGCFLLTRCWSKLSMAIIIVVLPVVAGTSGTQNQMMCYESCLCSLSCTSIPISRAAKALCITVIAFVHIGFDCATLMLYVFKCLYRRVLGYLVCVLIYFLLRSFPQDVACLLASEGDVAVEDPANDTSKTMHRTKLCKGSTACCKKATGSIGIVHHRVFMTHGGCCNPNRSILRPTPDAANCSGHEKLYTSCIRDNRRI